ncbi:tRNA threonylcarbamoyl adenosine modification protein YeaZ [Mesorhizobium albiziae]|uniref:tRNA threonylcarbamoyl adenosine modification protein YeaZ n=1 Tax=Neomesorhizobium albiziae TaxID=335020 RepID=A0A1I3WGY5_9HYPH|nr:tRNA (adenosine(37)-N6)-threonylcarbamoyltransferase complex dimerization subunit type 1 TsaB [Mesorhizobium albiziae]GLS31631.1 tRNA (adenosine(37)-N6)-threonylcarbamoyltransferase complex dimerization subunit type 1 TsaB [Mesorhizobium albiziae]SFK06964.1 tRNA threonylcarbamoyl adenosine modification protein YeaZ [Mesorhizobium albiziae]
MNLLAIDTSANLCAACVVDTETGRELGRVVRDIGKGHAELLIGIIEETLKASNVDYNGLGRIAVCTGPGSFTGVRVGVATARGLALALKIPATGVTTLEAIATEAREGFPGRAIMVAIDARREELYAAVYDEFGKILYAPAVINLQDATVLARKYRPLLAGSAAAMVAQAAAPDIFDLGSHAATADIGIYAGLALAMDPHGEKPKPVYLREPDAKPQAGLILPRSGG